MYLLDYGEHNPIYTILNNDGTTIEKYELDANTSLANNQSLASPTKKAEFLSGILYGNFRNGQSSFETEFHVDLNSTPLYERLKTIIASGRNITESLGVYYQDDKEGTPEVMKTEKRIITYTIQ